MEYSGTIVRKSFANGRYFIVDVTSDGKLEMPIQDGKMKEVKFQGIEIEGYDKRNSDNPLLAIISIVLS